MSERNYNAAVVTVVYSLATFNRCCYLANQNLINGSSTNVAY